MCRHTETYREGEGPLSPNCIFDGARLLPPTGIVEVPA
jgi:hypothetical protein